MLSSQKQANISNALAQSSNKYLKGIANLGYRPTFNQKKILLEVHLFNFSGNLYNKLLSVEFLKFIRKEKKFKNVDQLRKQIKSDLSIMRLATRRMTTRIIDVHTHMYFFFHFAIAGAVLLYVFSFGEY